MSIGDGAFSECKGLTSITIPRRFESRINYLRIPYYARITYI
jgi:hypothetical protein